MTSKSSISIRVGIDEDKGDYSLDDIPALAWEQFMEKAKLHFPKAQDPWAAAITEFIIAMGGGDGNRRTFIMTDVPEPMAQAMDNKLSEVDWTWDRLHAYLLRSVNSGLMHLVAMREKDNSQQFGTVIATGIRPEVFDRLEKAHPKLNIERYLGTLFMALAEGEIKIDPSIEFAEPVQR